VANGTDALEIALRALEIEGGDEVITVPNAGGYSTTACNLVGAVPVYVDVDPEKPADGHSPTSGCCFFPNKMRDRHSSVWSGG